MSLPTLLSGLSRAVAGVDGCRGGWAAAVRSADGGFATKVFPRFADLTAFLPADAVIAVDMPIGLPERTGAGGRGPEAALRPHLGPFASSVFSIPSRKAVYAAPGPFPDAATRRTGFRTACAAARQTSDPATAFSIQAFGLFPKIRELDALLRANAGLAARVIESHPEAAFRRLNGGHPLRWRKKGGGSDKSGTGRPGLAERHSLLVQSGLPAACLLQRLPGAGADDLLDAAVLLFSAARFARGEAVSFPDPPGRDGFGLPVAIWI